MRLFRTLPELRSVAGRAYGAVRVNEIMIVLLAVTRPEAASIRVWTDNGCCTLTVMPAGVCT